MGSLNSLELGTKRPLRVAAYCRISYEEERAGEGSFMNQKLFFRQGIEEHPDWVHAGVFGDYHRSGKQLKGRTEFQRMMQKAREGGIDFIITKSIARFARSAIDTMMAVKELNSLGVGVYFLSEDIDTTGAFGELILTILASIAEMESESISENMKTVFLNMNEKGTPLLRARYGYRKDGRAWKVEPNEALHVKLAFLMVSNGYPFLQIANRLNELEEEEGTEITWDSHRVKRLLASENYIGDILTNKTTSIWENGCSKQVKNDRLVDAFYIENHHDPIVGKLLFRKVNEKMKNRELPGQLNFTRFDDLKMLAEGDTLLMPAKKLLFSGASTADTQPQN